MKWLLPNNTYFGMPRELIRKTLSVFTATMKYYCLEPEIAGGLGPNTVMDRAVHPPTVSRLHYHLDGWLGDVILESFPCFIITENGQRELQSFGLTGARFDQVEVTTSEQFNELYPNRKIPKFSWLKVDGRLGQDDFATAPDGRLIVSGKALDVLRKLGISQAFVTGFKV